MRDSRPYQCESCNRGESIQTHLEQRQCVAGFVFTATLHARECPACRLREIDGASLAQFDLGVARALALSGVVDAEAFRFMRESVGYERDRAAIELGSSPSELAAWEAGLTPLPVGMMNELCRIVLSRTADPLLPHVTARPLARPLPDANLRRHRCA